MIGNNPLREEPRFIALLEKMVLRRVDCDSRPEAVAGRATMIRRDGAMNGSRLRTVTGSMAMLLAVLAGSRSADADVFANVPEVSAEGYLLVYTLPIENMADYGSPGSVPYTVDNSAGIATPFDRIAYYLELDSGSGPQYVYVSMDAFTSDLSRVGLPVTATGAVFQRPVSNMNVVSNASGVTTGTGLATGNIEFWPTNYAQANAASVPGASDAVFDFGDQRVSGGAYGSFQIHNHGAQETILAYNQWGGLQPDNAGDLGIGNAPVGNPDWTFAYNAADYTVKNLQVLVRPTDLSIDLDIERAVFQRDDRNQANVTLAGSVAAGITSIEARARPRAGSPGTATDWQILDGNPPGGAYDGSLTLVGGWYDIDVRSLDGATVVQQRTVERVGVGEVFVIAGQSNSANWGSAFLQPADDRVSAFDLNAWRRADDPQPIADGSGGSPWPALGDGLAAELDVPIGFITVGVGGTSVEQWLPGGSLYPRLRDALQALGPGASRAVLWHQGEADNLLDTSTADYRQRLEAIIAQSRLDAGFDIPWGIAQATFVPGQNPTTQQSVLDAQAQTATADTLNFIGAATDDLTGTAWRAPDLIHFNEAGLREHAARWQTRISQVFGQPPGRVPPTITVGKTASLLTIAWEASCSSGAPTYAIYEGSLGSWSSHVPLECTDAGGDLQTEVLPAAGDRYYLVVPLDADREGSYGEDSRGFERAVGASRCVTTQLIGICRP